jgi:hypothetical protein
VGSTRPSTPRPNRASNRSPDTSVSVAARTHAPITSSSSRCEWRARLTPPPPWRRRRAPAAGQRV